MSEAKRMRVTLPQKAKPSKVMPRDTKRPELCSAFLEERDGQSVLLATDAYRMVSLPVEVDGQVEPTHIPVEALKTVEKTGQCEIGEYVEPLDKQGNTNGVLFRKGDGDRPKWVDAGNEVWPDEPKPKDKLVIGLNAQFLHELAQAMAAPFGSVSLTVDLSEATPLDGGGRQYLRPITVEAHGARGAKGVLMPVRVRP